MKAVPFSGGDKSGGWVVGLLIAAGVAIHLLFLGSLSTGWLDLLFNDSSHTRRGFDFDVFYLAGQVARAGQDIYGIQAAFGFRYLPAFAHVIGRFFTLFSPASAYLVYLLITELILLADLWLTWHWAPAGTRRATLLFMWLAFTPYYLELYMGQVSFWAASLLFFLLYAGAQERPRAMALAWTAASLLKPNALILAPAFLRQRRFLALLFCLLAVVATSLPHFLLYPGSWNAFRELNLGTHHFKGALTHAGNLGMWGSLVSVGAKLADLPLGQLSALEELPLGVRAVVLLAVAGALGTAATVTFLAHSADRLFPFTLWLTTYFLVYKDVWEHHYVFLLPVLIVLYLRTSSLLLLAIFLVLALPTPFALFDISPGLQGNIDPERDWSLGISLLYRSTKLVPVLLLWIWQLRQFRLTEATS